MKKITRIFSVVMALVLMLSVAVLPANAAVPSDADVSFRLELSPETERKDSTGADPVANNVYRLDIFLTSNVRVATIIMGVTFDPVKFTPLDVSDEYIYTTDRSEGYIDVLSEWRGPLLEAGSVKSGRDTFYEPSNSAVKSAYKSAFTDNDDGILLWNYEPADKSAMIGMCTDEKVASVYLQLNAGQTAEGAQFGFGIGQGTSAKSVGFCSNPELGKYLKLSKADLINIVPLDLIGTPDYTYTAPVVTGPAVAKSKGQIKMTKTGADTVADDFSFRVISKITDTDWDKYFSGTMDSDTELGATNAIQKVGFVVAESGNFAMDGAKAAAKKYAESNTPNDEDLGVYKVATTNFIQKKDDASDAFFACRIDTSVSTKSDRKYIAFVQYKDKDGNIQYAFYDDAQEILLDSKYGDYKTAWLSQN